MQFAWRQTIVHTVRKQKKLADELTLEMGSYSYPFQISAQFPMQTQLYDLFLNRKIIIYFFFLLRDKSGNLCLFRVFRFYQRPPGHGYHR